jgi:hypothetical protein
VPTSKPLVIADARLHALLHDNLAIAELELLLTLEYR